MTISSLTYEKGGREGGPCSLREDLEWWLKARFLTHAPQKKWGTPLGLPSLRIFTFPPRAGHDPSSGHTLPWRMEPVPLLFPLQLQHQAPRAADGTVTKARAEVSGSPLEATALTKYHLSARLGI